MNQHQMYSRSGIDDGLIFINEMEIGSTVYASITARIAERYGRLKQQQKQPAVDSSAHNSTAAYCNTRFMPMRARKFYNRNPQHSFVWAVIQEPTERIIHKTYQYATLRKKISKDNNIELYAFQDIVLNLENQDYGYYMKSLPIREKLNPYKIELHDLYVKDILDSYDFLGIKERHYESLAVLQILLNLQIEDILYLQSPNVLSTGGNNDNNNNNNNELIDPLISQTDIYEQWLKGECRGIPVPKVTFEMKQWFYSEEFERFVEADVLVYKAVNKSLDNTIEALGRTRVDKSVKQIQWTIQKAKDICQPQVTFPCPSIDGGVKVNGKTDCYFSDVGCGHVCLDQFGETISKNSEFLSIS
jgi:hypothetical protein